MLDLQGFSKPTKKMGLNGFYDRETFREEKLMQHCSSKELELTAGEMLRQIAVNDKVRPTGREEQAEIARRWSKVKYCGGLSAPCRTAVFSEGNRRDRRNRAGRNDSGS